MVFSSGFCILRLINPGCALAGTLGLPLTVGFAVPKNSTPAGLIVVISTLYVIVVAPLIKLFI
jgi:hypothetical protein